MELLIGLSQEILVLLFILAIPITFFGGIGYIVYQAIKHLIRYNAEYQYQYAKYREAEQEAAELEAELEYMANEYDWSEEP